MRHQNGFMSLHVRGRTAVTCPGVFGARIESAKSNNGRPPLGTGDSFLINLQRHIFAIADSPEWNPGASREFLAAFNHMIEALYEQEAEIRDGTLTPDRLRDLLVTRTAEMVKGVDYRSSTTFTCLLVISQVNLLQGLLLHAGDSCLFKMDVGEGTISQISWTNMNFVGRSNNLAQIEWIRIDENTRFVLCTDGAQALSRSRNHGGLQEILLEAFREADISQVPDLIIDTYGGDIRFPDDIGLVVFNPNRLPKSDRVFICGGEDISVDSMIQDR